MAKREFSSISDVLKGTSSAIKLGTKRAINRSVSSTKTFISRNLKEEIGLKTRDINSRLKANKTQSGNNKPHSFRGSVGIATRINFPLRLFSPRRIKIKTGRGTRYGVTVKLGKEGKKLAEGGFLMNVRGKEIVAQRKGDARKPTKEVRTTLFLDSVLRNVKLYKTFLTKEFKRIKGATIKHAIQQRLNPDKGED